MGKTMSAVHKQSSDTTLKRQEICNVDKDMNKQSSGVNTFEKVFSDIRFAAKEMIPRMQKPSDKRSLWEKKFESSLRQAEQMFKDQDSCHRLHLGKSCVMEAALIASQKRNEETLVKEMDDLQQEIARREENIKILNLSLKRVKSCSKEDRKKWQRQIETQEEHVFILKKKTKILQNRVNTLKETVEVLRPKSDVTLGVRSGDSHHLELLIEKDAQLKQEYDEIQKELNNHDKLLSGHQVNMTDSPTTRGLSTLSTDKFENDEVTVRKHKPFHSAMPDGHSHGADVKPEASMSPLFFEEWFHGYLKREEAEKLLINDGDFLVRQSSKDTTQYVLSGRQHGKAKHMILRDPAGIVQTEDGTFESVPHLINFYRTIGISIVSENSELHLKQPIRNTCRYIF